MTGADVAGRLERLTGVAVRELRAAGSQFRWNYYRAVLDDGRAVFAKVAAVDLGGVFDAEARGLRWLGEAGTVGVPEVLGWDDATLVVSQVPDGRAGAAAAERFGRELARLHGAGAPRFGAPWPGFIASLFLPNDQPTPASRRSWPGHLAGLVRGLPGAALPAPGRGRGRAVRRRCPPGRVRRGAGRRRGLPGRAAEPHPR